MNRLTRRAVFGHATAAALLLAGCAATTSGLTPAQESIQQAIIDANLIIGSTTPPPGTGLEGAYAQFKAANPTLIPAIVDQQVQSAFAQVPGYLAALGAAATAATTTTASNLSGVMSAAAQVLNLIGPYVAKMAGVASANPITTTVLLVFQAVTTLIQNMQPVVAAISPSKAVGAPIVQPLFVNPDLTAGTARARLAGAVG